jgi:PPOX class probable F420-dependent enzyme
MLRHGTPTLIALDTYQLDDNDGSMDTAERREFVRTHRTCIFGYNRRDDGPAMTVVYYVVDGDDLLISTMAARAKAAAVRRNPKVSLCVLDEQWPVTYLQVYGNAVLEEDFGQAVDVMCRVIDLMADSDVSSAKRAEVESMCRKEDRVVIRVTPYATFATPPRHVYQGEDIDTLTHFTSSSQPWLANLAGNPLAARHDGAEGEVLVEEHEVRGQATAEGTGDVGQADNAGRCSAGRSGNLGDGQAGRGDGVVDHVRHGRGGAGDGASALGAFGQARYSAGDGDRLLAQVVGAIWHAGRGHGVGNKHQVARSGGPGDQLDRDVMQVGAVADRLAGDLARQQRASRPWLPVIQRAHAVEQVRRVRDADADRRVGDLCGGVGVPGRGDYPHADHGTDQVGSTGQLGGDRDLLEVTSRGGVQPPEHCHVRVDQVPGILRTAPGVRQERTLQVNAVDDPLVGQVGQHRAAFGELVHRGSDQARHDPRAAVLAVEERRVAGIVASALGKRRSPAAVHVNVDKTGQDPATAKVGCLAVGAARTNRFDAVTGQLNPAGLQHALWRDDPGAREDGHARMTERDSERGWSGSIPLRAASMTAIR